jgi:REP element-mobilizing transposase RayT
MPNYRRAFVAGGCWFFTVNLLDRQSRLLVEQIDALRAAVQWARSHYPFTIDAWVVVPDHLHAVWTLPEADADFSIRWRMIKSRFVRSISNNERRDGVRLARRERAIWQRRFGSTSSETKPITPGTLSIATSIRSSTASSRESAIGRIPHSTAMWRRASYRPIGPAMRVAAVNLGSVGRRAD